MREISRCAFLFAAIGTSATAATLHVPADYPTIQSCIDAAVSAQDECVVAPGTYHELINFLGKAITLRSSDGAAVTTIDGTGLNGSVVTCASGEGLGTVLNGFTIVGGSGTDFYKNGDLAGGGVFNYASTPTVANCVFTRNTSDFGGGMSNYFSSPNVENCTFYQNEVTYYGAGMDNYHSDPVVTDCNFNGNTANNSGGGMFNQYSRPSVTNSTFIRNASYSGGGIYNHDSGPTVSNSVLNANTAVFGGGMFNYLHGTPTVANCTFVGNTAAYGGGGMHNIYCIPMVTNCTFSANAAQSGAGAMYNYNRGNPIVTNCIHWGNSPEEIVNLEFSAPTIRFSNVRAGLPFDAVDGGGNIDLDPLFVHPPDPGPDGMWDGIDDDYGDLRLQPGSPCINAGDPTFVAQSGETDLDGHARVLCGLVDMGAYEFGIGDHDCDQAVNLNDFAAWSACMIGPLGKSPEGCQSFDFNADADVDLADFAQFETSLVP